MPQSEARGSCRAAPGPPPPFRMLSCPSTGRCSTPTSARERFIKLCDLGVGGQAGLLFGVMYRRKAPRPGRKRLAACGTCSALNTLKFAVPAALRARASGKLQLHQMLALSVRGPSSKLGVFFDTAKFYHYIEPKYFGELITATNVAFCKRGSATPRRSEWNWRS